MCRNFVPDPIDPAMVRAVLDAARFAPAAGNTKGLRLLVIDEPARYWDLTLPPSRRAVFPWPGLLLAPLLVVPLVSPEAYLVRYGEADKRATGLGDSVEAWAVPYWFVDGAMATENVLLAAEAADLGACFFGLFDHERVVLDAFGVPLPWRGLGTIALGHRGEPTRPSRSAERRRPPLDDYLWGVGTSGDDGSTVRPFPHTEA